MTFVIKSSYPILLYFKTYINILYLNNINNSQITIQETADTHGNSFDSPHPKTALIKSASEDPPHCRIHVKAKVTAFGPEMRVAYTTYYYPNQ